jgi:hypothetical protein
MGGSGKQKSAKPIFGWSVGGVPPLKIEFDFKDFDFKDFDFIIFTSTSANPATSANR